MKTTENKQCLDGFIYFFAMYPVPDLSGWNQRAQPSVSVGVGLLWSLLTFSSDFTPAVGSRDLS